MHEKARAEMLVGDSRQALKEEAPLDRVRSLTAELQQVAQALTARAAGGAAGGGPAEGPSAGAPPPGGDDEDVIDADFTPG